MPDFDLNKLVRPNILNLKPYRSARDDFKEGLLLDANEISIGSSAEFVGLSLNRYPDPHHAELRAEVGKFRNVNPNHIFAGNGSDEAIDLLIRIFCRPEKDPIIITPPTYGMYRVCADSHDVPVIETPLNPDFSLNPELVIQSASENNAPLIFLCSPNNPTANSLNPNDIKKILLETHSVVVVDEAYIDFSIEKSFVDELSSYHNLVVLQTLSKAFGLAGLRIGLAFANTEIIQLMMRVKPPYNVNSVTQKLATEALRNPQIVQKTIRELLAGRNFLEKELGKMAAVEKIFPSDANFLLIRVPEAKSVYKKLSEEGIIVRYRGDQLHCENTLRITVGAAAENSRLIEALNKILT